MRTRLGSDNPFGCDRYGFAWQHVPAGGAAHLDYGCGNGRFLLSLRAKRIGRLVGVDVSREAVEQARQTDEGLEIVHLTEMTSLPFPDGAFSSVTLMDVFEHVAEQRALLGKLFRVLQDDGILIVTVPRRHLFSVLDLGNLKFRFPRLHRWWYCRRHSPADYERRYLANPDRLIGDVSVAKRWHEHFSSGQLGQLLNDGGFEVVAFDGAGFFRRVLVLAQMIFNRLRPLRAGFERLIAWDARRFTSANLFCIARKQGSAN